MDDSFLLFTHESMKAFFCSMLMVFQEAFENNGVIELTVDSMKNVMKNYQSILPKLSSKHYSTNQNQLYSMWSDPKFQHQFYFFRLIFIGAIRPCMMT
jgi:hypothetical protein